MLKNILTGPTTAGGRHSQSVVTASVDGVKASANINVMNDLKLQSYLTYVGSSSMEVLRLTVLTLDFNATMSYSTAFCNQT